MARRWPPTSLPMGPEGVWGQAWWAAAGNIHAAQGGGALFIIRETEGPLADSAAGMRPLSLRGARRMSIQAFEKGLNVGGESFGRHRVKGNGQASRIVRGLAGQEDHLDDVDNSLRGHGFGDRGFSPSLEGLLV